MRITASVCRSVNSLPPCASSSLMNSRRPALASSPRSRRSSGNSTGSMPDALPHHYLSAWGRLGFSDGLLTVLLGTCAVGLPCDCHFVLFAQVFLTAHGKCGCRCVEHNITELDIGCHSMHACGLWTGKEGRLRESSCFLCDNQRIHMHAGMHARAIVHSSFRVSL
jgi:hypothetical protein